MTDANHEKPNGSGTDAVTPVPQLESIAANHAELKSDSTPTDSPSPDVDPAEATQEPKADEPAGYDLYHREEINREDELFSFRVNPESAPINFKDVVNDAPLQAPAEAPAQNSGVKITILISVIAVALALFAIFGSFFLQHKQPATDDLGEGVFNAAGLKGHLLVKWDKKAQYQLTIEPIDGRSSKGFAVVVGAPPRPLLVNIRLKDSSGTVLCNKDLLLKFDPAHVATLSGAKKSLPSDADISLLQSQELQREHGQDLFENEVGDAGQIGSIHAQGDLPCNEQVYKQIYYWDFSTDFPVLAEQAELSGEAAAPPATRTEKPTEQRSSRATAIKSLSAPIEGDDVITGFVPARGIAETRAGHVFLIDNSGLQGHATGWQIFPAAIHYRCDKQAYCIITRIGTASALHARLKR